jgi:nicotinate-nucleotide adenylyltransferase
LTGARLGSTGAKGQALTIPLSRKRERASSARKPEKASSDRALLALPAALASRRPRRVGLLGGSFNPAHGGHLHLSLCALRQLELDEIWWLVSPQNPLKPARGMAPLAQRLAGAAALAAAHPRLKVTDLETRLGTRYTVDTVLALRRHFPATRFVWLMGADNLRQIRHWQRWTEIFAALPIAVFARPSYSLSGLSGPAARRFARRRVPPSRARHLADLPPPAWVFFPTRLDTRSATAIRTRRAAAPSDARAGRRTE